MPVLARKPLPKPNPDSDPRFRKVMEQLKAGAAKTKAHVPATKKGGEAAAAAKGPPNERLAAGKAKQVDKIKEAKEGKPEPSSFLAILRAEIAKAMPKTLGATDNFDQTAQQMKGGLKGNVSQQKENSTKDVSGASKQTPAPAGEAKAGGTVPAEPAPGAPPVNAPEGMPEPKSDADVSLQDSKQDTDAQMKEAEVTPDQLKKANDPRFSAVLDAKSQVARQADAAPSQFRAKEKATLSTAAATAQADSRKGAAAMIGVRGGSNVRVLTRQQQQKAADEKKRLEVVAQIETIFTDTKNKVDQKLASLDTEVGAMFDQGTDAALNAMTSFVNTRMRKYKIDRYLSIPIVGAARWIRDQFVGLPDEVNVFYEQGRQLFQGLMDNLVVRVAALVERRLKEAKDEVAKGQAAIKKLVGDQPKELQQQLQKTVEDVTGRFAELEKGIEDKKNQLAQALAAKYKEAFDKANEALKKIRDENKGLVAGFLEKLGEVIKALMEFKDKLMAILRKGAETIKLIIADPLGFLSNLIAAVKGGIQAFVGNIWTHLKKGFMQWLFGALAGAGIEIPSDLSLPSILKLVLGVLGITYDRMRAKAVKLIGERNVKIIEKLVEYIKALITGGPAALWEKVKEDLSNLKSMVIDAIQNWLIETVVKQAVAKIVSLFNPAGAIIQAIIAIYNIVMFVIEKAQQIMAFVEAVVNSVHAIATGAIGGAIAWIEQALARTIPIVIGFLARLIGLGGISQKIKDFILKVQAKVDAAIDKAIAKVVAFVKKLFGKGGKAGADDKGETEQSKKVRAGVAAAVSGKKLANRKDEEALFESVYGTFKPQGLKSLEFLPKGKTMSVIVTASLPAEVAALNLNDPVDASKMRGIMSRMRSFAPSTSIFAYYNGIRVDSVKNWPGHAEWKFVTKSIGKLKSRIKADLKKKVITPTSAISVRFDMTRSPCDGCADTHITNILAELKADPALAGLKITLELNAAAATQGASGESGLEKLLDPKNAGKITIKASDIWTVIEQKLRANPQFYDTLSKKHYGPDKINEYKRQAADLSADIDQIVKLYNLGLLPKKK